MFNGTTAELICCGKTENKQTQILLDVNDVAWRGDGSGKKDVGEVCGRMSGK